MSGTFITYTIDDSVAIITIDNPPMNPLTAELRNQLLATLDELDSKKDEIKAVILTGKGKAFMAGADIKSFPELTQEKARARLKKGKRLYLRVEEFERPIICAINGYCLGAGLELAMCCDIRIASSKAELGQPEINVGLIPNAAASPIGGRGNCQGAHLYRQIHRRRGSRPDRPGE